MPIRQTRRQFLAGGSLAGGALLVRGQTAIGASDALETTSVRLGNDGVIIGRTIDRLLRQAADVTRRSIEETAAAI